LENAILQKNAKMPFLTANITAMLLYQIEKQNWSQNFLHERLLGRKLWPKTFCRKPLWTKCYQVEITLFADLKKSKNFVLKMVVFSNGGL